MAESLWKNIEYLLLLKENCEKLDSSGLTRIIESTDEWVKAREKHVKKLTPIERLMDVILVSVNGELSENYSDSGRGTMFLDFYPQEPIGKYRVDFFIRILGYEQGYIIECDGHEFHEKTKEQAKYDKQRERFLVNCGYKVLRYSGSEILNNFEGIKKELIQFFEKEYKTFRG